MKKILCILLFLLLISGCSSSGKQENPENQEENETAETPQAEVTEESEEDFEDVEYIFSELDEDTRTFKSELFGVKVEDLNDENAETSLYTDYHSEYLAKVKFNDDAAAAVESIEHIVVPDFFLAEMYAGVGHYGEEFALEEEPDVNTMVSVQVRTVYTDKSAYDYGKGMISS